MRSNTTIIQLFLLCALLFACGDSGIQQVMDKSTLLLDSCPEQAVAMLDSIKPTAMKQRAAKRYRYVLLNQMARHKAWMPIEVDTTLMEAVIYTNRHGSSNERLTANYLLGYGYAEHGWNTEAQQAYFRAIEAADTTASDCDFSRLAKVYGQLATLYTNKTHPDLAIENCDKMKHYANIGKDTLSLLDADMLKVQFMYDKSMYREALNISKDAYNQFAQLNDTMWVGHAAHQIAYGYTLLNMVDSASKYFSIYESIVIKPHGIAVGYDGYFSLKGLLFEKKQLVDSAAAYYHKQDSLESYALKIDAQIHLAELYEKIHLSDSVLFYTKSCRTLYERLDSLKNENKLQELHARYNYNHLQNIISTLTQENLKYRYSLIIILLIIVLIIVCIYTYKNKAKLTKVFLFTHLEHLHQRLGTAMAEEKPILRKAIEKRERELSPKDHWDILIEQIRLTEEFSFLDNLAKKDKHMPKDYQETLKDIIKLYFRTQYELIKSKGLKEVEENICFLVLFGFKTKAIATLLCKTKPAISNSRSSLAKKIFGESCSIHDFDDKLKYFTP